MQGSTARAVLSIGVPDILQASLRYLWTQYAERQVLEFPDTGEMEEFRVLTLESGEQESAVHQFLQP